MSEEFAVRSERGRRRRLFAGRKRGGREVVRRPRESKKEREREKEEREIFFFFSVILFLF